MISFLIARKIDIEIKSLRRQWKSQGRDLDYIRFPRLYRFLRWDISDPEHDEKRGGRLVVISHLLLMANFVLMAVYGYTGWYVLWAPWYEWPVGAAFSLIVTILYWEPYRQDVVWGLTLALPIQMLTYLGMGMALTVLLINSLHPIHGAMIPTSLLAVAFFCCYRLGRLYERDVLLDRAEEKRSRLRPQHTD